MFNMDAKDSGYFFAVDTDYWLISGQLHLGLNHRHRDGPH